MFKTRSKLLLLGALSIVLYLFTKIKKNNIQKEYIKDLIRKRKREDLNSVFNYYLITSRDYYSVQSNDFNSEIHFNPQEGSFTFQNLSFLIGMYEISRDFKYLREAVSIIDKHLTEFNTPSGIPLSVVNPNSTSKTVNVDIFSKYALEYYYLGDYFLNNTFTDAVDKGLNNINSLLQVDRAVVQVNILNPFKSQNSQKPSKLYPLLLSLYQSTKIVKFKEMYDKSMEILLPSLTSIGGEECFIPHMLISYNEGSQTSKELGYSLLRNCTLKNSKEKCNVETYFYMYRLSKSSYWREVAWDQILSNNGCLNDKDLRWAYLLFSTEFSLDEYVFSNGFPIPKRGFGTRKTWLPTKQESCLDCIDGYGLDSLLNGAFS